jgi:membrane-associated phospholipid phosphatase
VGATRVADGSHWPVDVAVGGAIGLVAEMFSRRIGRTIRRRAARGLG